MWLNNTTFEQILNITRREWVSELEFKVPFQHKHGYIRDELRVVFGFLIESESNFAISINLCTFKF